MNTKDIIEEKECPECHGAGQVSSCNPGNYAMFKCNTCKGKGTVPSPSNKGKMKKEIMELADKQKAEGKESSPASKRFLRILKEQNLKAAFCNGMTLDQLCDFLERPQSHCPHCGRYITIHKVDK